MKIERVYQEIQNFNEQTHGSSDYYKEIVFVSNLENNQFAPIKYLLKNIDALNEADDLIKLGLTTASYDLYEQKHFADWYNGQFGRKLKRGQAKKIILMGLPENKKILEAVETVNKCYEILREQHIIMNGKNLPIQLGEWYAKCIFGLQQIKSSSQRGFDFFRDNKRIEIKIHWGDFSSPKGVKLRKSLVSLSDYSIIIYLGRDFLIREICFLDSEYITRKFSAKGHTIFLKDSDVTQYFFSNSDKHYNKVLNNLALMKFCNPNLAMRLSEHFQ